MNNYTAKDFVDLIDSKFEEFVGKVKRTDVSWGIWSREMNIAIKEKINKESPKFSIFGMVFSYWILVSQLLDLLYDCKGLKAIVRQKKIKAKTEEAISLRESILKYNETS